MYLCLAPQTSVVLDGEPVCLILDPRHELEALGMAVDGDLNIIIVESPGPVIVILYHAADRNVKLQFAQHTQRDVHLSAAAVHEDPG